LSGVQKVDEPDENDNDNKVPKNDKDAEIILVDFNIKLFQIILIAKLIAKLYLIT